MQEDQEKMPAGRPSDYNAEIGAEICALYADGVSLRDIEKREGMPARSTIMRWVFTEPQFSDQYMRAQEIRTELDADELKDIADDGSNDWMERHNKDGEFVGWTENGEAVRRSALRVDTRKWLMARRAPKKYGDKIQQEVTGEIGIKRILVPDRTKTQLSNPPDTPDFE